MYANPPGVYADPSRVYANPARVYANPSRVYANFPGVNANPPGVNANPPGVYADPSRVYANPARLCILPVCKQLCITASGVRFWPNMNRLRNGPAGFADVVEVVLSQLLPNPSRGSPLTKYGSAFCCQYAVVPAYSLCSTLSWRSHCFILFPFLVGQFRSMSFRSS